MDAAHFLARVYRETSILPRIEVEALIDQGYEDAKETLKKESERAEASAIHSA